MIQPLALGSSKADPRGPISLDVTYDQPIVVRTHLGGTPRDYFDQNPTVAAPQVPCNDNACGALPQEVYLNLPMLNDDGTPKMQTVHRHLQDAPYSPVTSGLLSGGLAAAALGTVGVIAGSIMGAPWMGALAGVLSGAVIGGAGGAVYAHGDRVRLEYEVRPITTAKYLAYKESVQPGTVQGQQGYFHRYTPVFEVTKIGEYKIPRIVHYRAGSGS